MTSKRRLALAMAGVAGVACLVAGGLLIGWLHAIFLTAMGMMYFALDQRFRTVVTRDTIQARGIVHSWTMPVDQTQELVIRDVGGDPVYVLTTGGRRRRLPKVEPEHVPAISELTGLPIHDQRS
ncbi:hypothetical protein [Kineosporia succinea]|uniref:PH (Pleckstrin Homology) domain-containing protein n=1 Tax=Kineosporia succinea TaxID=84632 RepID=A0ABT9PCF9_9ACTN|nr:hypothetical protein [Kineosporia succinea]MDP9830396.1 hypothetical protein [Kineosporia succinea]